MISWSLHNASAGDIDELMKWFPDARSVKIWGGPAFRFPFDRESFFEDCRWQDFSSYCLRSPDNEFAAFGQTGSRYGRAHLARLISNPNMRRSGVGRKLLELLIAAVSKEQDFPEVGLLVYKDNTPAYQCYQSVGFEVQEYPDGAPLPGECYYMTRSVNQT